MYDLIIAGGTVVTPHGTFIADIAVQGHAIAAISDPGSALGEARETLDARGMFVLPGAVDVHTHVRPAADDFPDRFFRDSVAAACGGTTSYLAFAWQPLGGSLHATLREFVAMTARDAAVDYGVSLIMTDASSAALAEIPRVIEAGVPTFKAFMVYDFRVSDAALFDAMRHTHAAGGMMQVHCENCAVIDFLVAENLGAGRVTPRYHAASRPPAAEAEATHRAIALAAMADAPVYSVHLSCREALRHVREAKAAGQRAYAETCPHYLTLSDDRYNTEDAAEAAKYICSPPLRPRDHADDLWAALRDGDLDLIATDHVPDRFAVEKKRGAVPFDQIGNGAPGIETLLSLAYSEGVTQGRVSLERMVELVSTRPAQIFGLTNKGALEPGKDADIVVFDPSVRRTITQQSLHHACDFTPYEGIAVQGKVRDTISRGRIVVRDAEFIGTRGAGAFVERALGRA